MDREEDGPLTAKVQADLQVVTGIYHHLFASLTPS
jgi:hypothetical protein